MSGPGPRPAQGKPAQCCGFRRCAECRWGRAAQSSVQQPRRRRSRAPRAGRTPRARHASAGSRPQWDGDERHDDHGIARGQAKADSGPDTRDEQLVAGGHCHAPCCGPAEPDDEASEGCESEPMHRREGDPADDRIKDVPQRVLVPEVPVSGADLGISVRLVRGIEIGTPIPMLKREGSNPNTTA